MRTISASKLRKTRAQSTKAQDSLDYISDVVYRIVDSFAPKEKLPEIMQKITNNKRRLFVIFASDKGLCGGFNSSIAKTVKLSLESVDADVMCVGSKVHDIMQKHHKGRVIAHFKNISSYRTAKKVTNKIFEAYEENKYASCDAFYILPTKHTMMSMGAFSTQILPLCRNNEDGDDVNQTYSKNLDAKITDHNIISENWHKYAPNKLSALNKILPLFVSTHIYAILMKNQVSEHRARMVAMESATNNAKTMVDKLTVRYNRSRQAEITKDLIEVTSGAEVLTND